jgi:hypothetical protein
MKILWAGIRKGGNPYGAGQTRPVKAGSRGRIWSPLARSTSLAMYNRAIQPPCSGPFRGRRADWIEERTPTDKRSETGSESHSPAILRKTLSANFDILFGWRAVAD